MEKKIQIDKYNAETYNGNITNFFFHLDLLPQICHILISRRLFIYLFILSFGFHPHKSISKPKKKKEKKSKLT